MTGRSGTERLTLFPLRMVLAYLAVTFALFFIWPINWTLYDSWTRSLLIIYVVMCFAAVYLAGALATRREPRPGVPIPVRFIVAVGGVLAVLLLTPLSFAYTEKGPWEVFSALGDQRLAYEDVQQLIARSSGTSPVVLLGAVLAPITFAAPVLGVLYWREFHWGLRLLTSAAILTSIVLSILKGTDREIANLVIILIGILALRAARDRPYGSLFARLLRHHRGAVLLMGVALAIAATIYVERKSDRLGGTASACAIGTGICADLDSPAISWLGEKGGFGASTLVLSLTQGYYGLGIAMEQPFDSTYGFGHSPALLSFADRAFGSGFSSRAYTAKIAMEDGWSDRNFWSSAMSWWANDFGFPGALIVVGLFGYLLGATWRDAVLAASDSAAVLFVLALTVLVYLPMNNQLFLVIDSYLTFVVWFVVWLMPGGIPVPRR